MYTPLRDLLNERSRTIHAVSPTATVAEAIDRMNAERIGSVLVMDGERVLGIFTERDVLTKVVGKIDPGQVSVSELMTRQLVTLKPSASVEDAMRVVTEKRIRHLPVVDGERLLGLVSSGDLTRWAVRDKQDTIDDLMAYINDWKR